MTRLRRLISRTILFVGVAAIIGAAPGATSTAQGTEQQWVTVPGGLPLFDLAGITPGDSGSAVITVTNPQSSPVTFSIAVTALTNDDNGCNEPEQAIGDTTCGAGGGELQLDLRLTLTAMGQTDTSVAAAAVAEWAAQPAADPLVLGDHETRSYRIGYELPISSTNMIQSDLVAFQFEMRLDGEAGSVASQAPAVAIVATSPLVQTGVDSIALIMLGSSAILSGLALYWFGVRR